MNDVQGGAAVGGPARTCVGCRRVRRQDELMRLHLDARNRLTVNRNGSGRGAWLCLDDAPNCFAAAVGRKAFARAFRRTPDPASVEAMAARPPFR